MRFFPLFLLCSLLSHAQSIREDIYISYPSKSSDANSGKKVITIRMPVDWQLSDTSAVTLLKTLSPSPEPYYLMDNADTSHYIALLWKKELAPNIFQFILSEHFDDGSLKRYDVLNERGKKNGTHIEYWQPGVIRNVGAYMNGKRDDKWQEYDSTGKLTQVLHYSVGEKEKEKLIKKPHQNWYGAIVARTPVKPYNIVPYSVLKGSPPEWKINEKNYAQVWSVRGGVGVITAPEMFNINYPSLLGKPENENVSVFFGLQWWDPSRWWYEIEMAQWIMTSTTGDYQGTKVKSGVQSKYISFSAGKGLYRRDRSAMGVQLGMTLAKADLASLDLEESNNQGNSYFELSSLKQGPMITPAVYYDLRFPFKGKITPGIFFKAGYHIAVSDAQWHLLDSPLKNREAVNMSGLFLSASFKISRLRRI